MKKFVGIALTFVLLFSSVMAAGTRGSWETSIKIDQSELVTRVELNYDDTIYIQLRPFLEHLAYRVRWDSEKNMVIAERNNERMQFYIGKNYGIINGLRLYFTEPVYNNDGATYISLNDIRIAFNLGTESIDKAEVNNRINGIVLKSIYNDYENLTEYQKKDYADPRKVCDTFIFENLGFDGIMHPIVLSGENEEIGRIRFDKYSEAMMEDNTKGLVELKDLIEIHIDLIKIKNSKGDDIWIVDNWFDENSLKYNVRNLNDIKELFHYDYEIPKNIRDYVSKQIVDDWTETFSKYYHIVGFEAFNMEYTANSSDIEMKFILSMKHRVNYDNNRSKNPDTVEYIKESKEANSINYPQLFDEYNMIKEANFTLKVNLKVDDDGNILTDSYKIYHNASPNSEEYTEFELEDFIIE